MASRVTADDRSLAEQMIQAVRDDGGAALARIIAAIHERAVVCAVVRVEREVRKTRRGT